MPFSRLTVSKKAIQIAEIGCVTLDTGYVPANRLHGFIQLLLPAASDENISAFFNEQLGACQCHAARSACDDSDFSFKLSHNVSSDRSVIFHA